MGYKSTDTAPNCEEIEIIVHFLMACLDMINIHVCILNLECTQEISK
jgi:hypothetical protein